MVSNTFAVLIPVLFVLSLGYFAWRAKKFDADQVAGINELALEFALPASLFIGIVGIPRTQLLQDARFVGAVLVDLIGIYLVAFIIGNRLLRLSTTATALFALGAAFPAAPFFGPAVLGGLFGASSAVAVATTAIIANLVLVPVTVVLLEASSRTQRPNVKALAAAVGVGPVSASSNGVRNSDAGQTETKTVIRNSLVHAAKQPYVWAPVIALVLVLIGIHVPSLLLSMLKLIGQATSGVSLFVGGLLLAAYSVRLNRTVALNVVLKSVIQPALLVGLMIILGLPRALAREGIVAAALPSAVIAPMLAARYKTYEAEAGSTMLLSTVLMMVAVPVSMILFA
jgi:malonate transporter and related proteins